MIRGVLFDLDGVLVDSYEVWFPLLNATARHLGYPEIPRERYRSTWGQGVQQDVAAFFPGEDVESISRDYTGRFADHGELMSVDPDAALVLADLQRRSLPVAVVTNTPRELAEAMLSCAGLAVEVIVGGTDTPHPKPAPDMVLLACERIGVAPADCLMIGDSRYDREASRAAGVPFVGYRLDGDLRVEKLGDILTHLDGPVS